MSIDFEKLKEPFPEADIEWRVARADGTPRDHYVQVLAYVDARAVMDRLDEVCGPGNWRPEYQAVQGGFLCGLSIRDGGEWITKWDGSDESDIESFKGGISGALKRAAVLWGIGRYLYNLPSGYGQIVPDTAPGVRRLTVKPRGGAPFETYWVPPTLPIWALPKVEAEKRRKGREAGGAAPTPAPQAKQSAVISSPRAAAQELGPEHCGMPMARSKFPDRTTGIRGWYCRECKEPAPYEGEEAAG